MTCKSKGTLKEFVHGVINTETEDWTSNCTQLCFVQLISLTVILCWLTDLTAIVNEDLIHFPQAAIKWFKVCCLDSSKINNYYSTRLHLRSCSMCVWRCLVPVLRSPRPSRSIHSGDVSETNRRERRQKQNAHACMADFLELFKML